MKTVSTKEHINIQSKDLVPFLLISFGIAWGILALYIFADAYMTQWCGALTGNHPLFYLAVYSPAIAALGVLFRRRGRNGVVSFLSQVKRWGLSRGWTFFLLVVLPVPFFLGAALQGRLADWRIEPTLGGVLAILLMFIKGPVEEIGWRGFAQPLLQRHMCPLVAALVLGVVWGVWHYPAFLLSGTPQSTWSFGAFFLGTIALSVIVTALFNQSKGSLLVPVLFHFQMINPIWPDGQPTDTLFFVVLAAIITAIKWRSMFTRKDAITSVLRDKQEGSES